MRRRVDFFIGFVAGLSDWLGCLPARNWLRRFAVPNYSAWSNGFGRGANLLQPVNAQGIVLMRGPRVWLRRLAVWSIVNVIVTLTVMHLVGLWVGALIS